jgi:NTP pyrophosphatase (non-canonical NTP hydrolase)
MTTESEILDFAERNWGQKSLAGVALKLAEETGEIAGACVKIPEGRATEAELDKELGDALIVLSQLAAKRGTTLEALRAQRFEDIKIRAMKRPASL